MAHGLLLRLVAICSNSCLISTLSLKDVIDKFSKEAAAAAAVLTTQEAAVVAAQAPPATVGQTAIAAALASAQRLHRDLPWQLLQSLHVKWLQALVRQLLQLTFHSRTRCLGDTLLSHLYTHHSLSDQASRQ